MPQPIEIRDDLWQRLAQSAEYHGYSSPQEYATAILEKELDVAPNAATDQEVTRKMEELGYLDFGRDI